MENVLVDWYQREVPCDRKCAFDSPQPGSVLVIPWKSANMWKFRNLQLSLEQRNNFSLSAGCSSAQMGRNMFACIPESSRLELLSDEKKPRDRSCSPL